MDTILLEILSQVPTGYSKIYDTYFRMPRGRRF